MEFCAKFNIPTDRSMIFIRMSADGLAPRIHMYTVCEAFELMKDEMSDASRLIVKESIMKGSLFYCKGESERSPGKPSCHACLSLWKAYRVLNDESY